MALPEVAKVSSTPHDEKPRGDTAAWYELGRIVYAWTDERESRIDKAWWIRPWWTRTLKAEALPEEAEVATDEAAVPTENASVH